MSNNNEQNTLESLQFKLDSALRRQDEAMQDAAIWKDAYRIEKDAHSVTLQELAQAKSAIEVHTQVRANLRAMLNRSYFGEK